MTTPVTTTLNFGTTLTRWPISHPDTLQSPIFWQKPLDEMYAQMPFPSLWQPLRLHVFHMDHPELDARIGRRTPCLEDYAPDQPGFQVAAGLQMDFDVAIALFPTGYTTGVYTGPERALSASSCAAGRKVMAHEAWHYAFFMCRYGHLANDDVSRLNTTRFRELRPRQAENEYEDAAETGRAVLGCNETRGTFSDGKPFTASPELYALLRCMYQLTASLKGAWVASYAPQAGGIMYQFWAGFGWKWRFISSHDWRQQEWNGSTWQAI